MHTIFHCELILYNLLGAKVRTVVPACTSFQEDFGEFSFANFLIVC